jgi:hypothetical protein
MSDQPTLWDTPSVTSSPAAASGPSPSGMPDGPTSGPSGPEAAPAPASARQAKDKGLMILVTSGLLGRDSSASAALQQSLESRLAPRLDTAGSTLFKLTWKHKTTPLGRQYLERAASALRTSGKGSTSLVSARPTPQASDMTGGGQAKRATEAKRPSGSAQSSNLNDHVLLASWSTPRNEDAESAGMRHSRGVADTLTAQTSLAAWATPRSVEAGHSTGNPDRAEDKKSRLEDQVFLSSWATPAERDYRTANLKSFAERGGGKKGEQLQNQVKHLAAWPTPAQNGNNEAGNNDSSRKTVELLAGWHTPTSNPATYSGGNAPGYLQLPGEVKLAAWPSPCTPNGGRSMSIEQMDPTGKTLDGRKHTASLEHAVKFVGPVRLTAGGEVRTGLDAGMESSGQLNPAHSRWLMGVPSAWDGFACTAMQSLSPRRKRLLKATSKPNAPKARAKNRKAKD